VKDLFCFFSGVGETSLTLVGDSKGDGVGVLFFSTLISLSKWTSTPSHQIDLFEDNIIIRLDLAVD